MTRFLFFLLVVLALGGCGKAPAQAPARPAASEPALVLRYERRASQGFCGTLTVARDGTATVTTCAGRTVQRTLSRQDWEALASLMRTYRGFQNQGQDAGGTYTVQVFGLGNRPADAQAQALAVHLALALTRRLLGP